MILQALAKYYEVLAEDGKVSKPGWCSAKVSYQIALNKEGEVKGIISLKKEEERGKKTVWAAQPLLVPELRDPPAYLPMFCVTMRNICWEFVWKRMKRIKRGLRNVFLPQKKNIFLS